MAQAPAQKTIGMTTLLRAAGAAMLAGIAGVNAAQAAPSGICSEANVNAYMDQNPRYSVVDKAIFYRTIRDIYDVYDRSGPHYAGTDAILDYWNEDQNLPDDRWLAYILATAYHETAFRMAPVRETLASDDDTAIRRLEDFYERRGSTGPVYWRPVEETGKAYFGRGYVQLTWDWNYKRADKRFDIPNETSNDDSYYWNPTLALEPSSSIRITYDGMIYGWYTGHCLLRHIEPNRRADYGQARRIINGLDKASKIAEHAAHFMEAIDAARVDIAPPPSDDAPSYDDILANIARLSGRNTAPRRVRRVTRTSPPKDDPTYADVVAHWRRIMAERADIRDAAVDGPAQTQQL